MSTEVRQPVTPSTVTMFLLPYFFISSFSLKEKSMEQWWTPSHISTPVEGLTCRWRTALDTQRGSMTGKPKRRSQSDFWIDVVLGKAKVTWDEERSAASNFAVRIAVTGELQALQESTLRHVFKISKLTHNIWLNDSLAVYRRSFSYIR